MFDDIPHFLSITAYSALIGAAMSGLLEWRRSRLRVRSLERLMGEVSSGTFDVSFSKFEGRQHPDVAFLLASAALPKAGTRGERRRAAIRLGELARFLEGRAERDV